jgi:hypothetical protein
MNGSGHFGSIGTEVANTSHFYSASLEVHIFYLSFGAGVISAHDLDRIAFSQLCISLLQFFPKSFAQG